MFETVRELGLRITYALLEAVVRAKRDDTGSLISVRDVNEALTSMGLESNSEIYDETVLFSCPPADELMKRANQPPASQADEEEEERLVHADRGRDVMYRRMVRSAADIVRSIHSPPSAARGKDKHQDNNDLLHFMHRRNGATLSLVYSFPGLYSISSYRQCLTASLDIFLASHLAPDHYYNLVAKGH